MTIEESDDREDSFYIYEHEPIVSYKLKILEIRNSKAHIQCSGILIVDRYTEPYEQEKFEIDSWIPVIRAEGLIPRRLCRGMLIESVKDWGKFGL